jgi:cytochrome P450
MAMLAEGARPELFGSRAGVRLFPWIRARREAERLLDEEIAAHRADPAGRDDVLAMLLAARDEDGSALHEDEVRDQLLTLLVAGHETTATTLAWAFERLTRHPEALAWVRAGGDERLDALIDETLRVRPVVDQVARRVSEPFALDGYRLPGGTNVAPSILGVQLDEAQYPEPERFRPQRFEDAPAPAYALIPFGGGSRRCIGASFARMEMKTILRAVLDRVELQPTTARPERPTRARRFTTVPSRGAVVTVRPKQSSRP